MKETALTKIHQALSAKMASFAGYNMPIQYEGINIEHETVRNSVGVFDVSHMGEFLIKGKNALDLIQRVTTNDASKLEIGNIQYSCMTNNVGGIVDDLLVYRVEEDTYMLVVNASNILKDWNWIKSKNIYNCEMLNISDETSLLAVQGPKAINVLQELTSMDLKSIPYYSFKLGTLAGVPKVIISNTGYTGAGGFELYFPNRDAVYIWKQIFITGEKYGIKPIGLGARDTLRLEMGYCLYGNDINDLTNPLEAGLGWITKFDKEFTSSLLISNQRREGISKKLVGFEMIDKGIPRHDYVIVDKDGHVIGNVTSGTQSPTLKKAIGMGYVKTEFSKPGTEIFVKIRDNNIKALVKKAPFVDPTVK
jgi:aminomethyltransferase